MPTRGAVVGASIHDGEHFNLELNVDAYSGAFVGASIHDEENSRAVIEAFEDGVETTGARPSRFSSTTLRILGYTD